VLAVQRPQGVEVGLVVPSRRALRQVDVRERFAGELLGLG
jgi:hypothetical protein